MQAAPKRSDGPPPLPAKSHAAHASISSLPSTPQTADAILVKPTVRQRTSSSPFIQPALSSAAKNVAGKSTRIAAKASGWSRKKFNAVSAGMQDRQANSSASSSSSHGSNTVLNPVVNGIVNFGTKARGLVLSRNRSASTPAQNYLSSSQSSQHSPLSTSQSSSQSLTQNVFGVKVPRNVDRHVFGQSLSVATRGTRLLRPDEIESAVRNEEPNINSWPPAKRKRARDRIDAKAYLPALAIRCLDYIELHALSEEGLYRVPGSAQQVQLLRALFDAGLDLDLSSIPTSELDPHSVASCFKLWLRELPESILTPELEPMLDQIMLEEVATPATSKNSLTHAPAAHGQRRTSNTVSNPSPQLVDKISIVLSTLALDSWYLIRELAAHFSLIDQHSTTNKMTLSNLRLILSPTLRMSPSFLQLLVEQRETLFDKARAHMLATPVGSPSPSIRYPSNISNMSEQDMLPRRPSKVSETASVRSSPSHLGPLAQQQAAFMTNGVHDDKVKPSVIEITPIATRFAVDHKTPAKAAPLSAPPFVPSRSPNPTFFSSNDLRPVVELARPRTSSISSQTRVQSLTLAPNGASARERTNSVIASPAIAALRQIEKSDLRPARHSSLGPNSEGMPPAPELRRSMPSSDSSSGGSKRASRVLDEDEETLNLASSPKRARVPSLAPSIQFNLAENDDFLSLEDRRRFFEA